MEILYICNLAFATALLIAPLWWSKRFLNLNWLNPVSIATLFALPVGLFRLYAGQIYRGDGMFYFPYQFAVLMTNMQQLIFTLLLIFALKTRLVSRSIYKLPRLGNYSRHQLSVLSLAFLTLYTVAFLLLTMKSGGLWDWLSNIRHSYISKREGNGIYYAGALSFLSISYFFRGISCRSSRYFTAVSVMYFSFVYVLGSKGFLLLFFVFYLIIIWKLGTVNIERMILFGMPVVFLVMLINFFSQQDSIDLSSIIEYFDYYPNAAKYYNDYFSGAIDLFGGKVLLSSLWEYVPRGLFPAKPHVYGALYIVEHYYPGGAESGNTPAFYGGVSEFADFGVFGVLAQAILNPGVFIYATALHYVFKQQVFLKTEVHTGRSLLVCLLIFAPAFGTFIPVGLLLLFLVLLFLYARFILLFIPVLRLAASVPPYD